MSGKKLGPEPPLVGDGACHVDTGNRRRTRERHPVRQTRRASPTARSGSSTTINFEYSSSQRVLRLPTPTAPHFRPHLLCSAASQPYATSFNFHFRSFSRRCSPHEHAARSRCSVLEPHHDPLQTRDTPEGCEGAHEDVLSACPDGLAMTYRSSACTRGA